MGFENGKRLALLAVLAAGLAACSSMGNTVADDDPETTVPNTSLGRSMMESLGAVSTRQTAAINYTPRAPLVAPPAKSTLVAPEDPNKVASLANWPVDPEKETARRLREADAREAGREDSDRTPPHELLATRLPGGSHQTADQEFDATSKPLPRHKFEGMKSTGVDPTGVYDANGDPRRRALVDPPVSYLEPAPGAAVTTEERKKDTPSFWQRIKFW